jgi:hypothetical protein
VQEALSGPQQQQWKAAMDRGLSNLQIKATWQEIKAPQDRAKIGARWVLKIKRDAEPVKRQAVPLQKAFAGICWSKDSGLPGTHQAVVPVGVGFIAVWTCCTLILWWQQQQRICAPY